MKAKTSLGWLLVVLVLAALAAWWLSRRDRAPPASAPAVVASGSQAAAAAPAVPAPRAPGARPGAEIAEAADAETASGMIDGRVLNGVTREGVPNAELSFLADGGVSTVRTGGDGAFELRPAATGTFVLSTITAPGFLPYAPELGHSSVRLTLMRNKAVHGVTLLLYPAVEYQGLVVDARSAPVAGARVRLLGSPSGEQVLEGASAEWKTGRDGRFTFHAATDAVLEARSGNLRGWARIDRAVALRKKVTIQIGDAPARDATITGHVRDDSGAPIGDALVRAEPSKYDNDLATVFATTGADGAFTLAGVDRGSYDLSAQAEDHVQGERANVTGGSRDIDIVLASGLPLEGRVVDARGAPVPVFTLVVRRRQGAGRPLATTRSLIDPQGRFAVRVAPGDYDVQASARGYARATPTQAAAGATDVRIVLPAGATLRGKIAASDSHAPIAGANVGCEQLGGGASAMPADAGTVTRADGMFELTGISPGPLSIRVDAEGFDEKIEAGMTATDGAALGPITVELTRATGDAGESHIELVGIGVGLRADGDALRVTSVLPGSGAFDAGVGSGDRVVAVDGQPVAPIGLEGAIAKIRGLPGTTVTITLRRDSGDVLLVIERRKIRT